MRKNLCLLLSALIVTACHMGDPSCLNQTAPTQGVMWKLCSPQIPPYCPPYVCVPEEGEILSGGDLVNIALCNNPQTKQSWATARAAAYNWRATKSAYYPEINFTEQVVISEVSFPDLSSSNNPAQGGITFGGYTSVAIHQVTLSYLLLDFGGRDATVEAARQSLLAANWTNNREIQTVVLSVLENYYNYLAALSDREAKIKNLEDAEANLDAASTKFEAGLAQIVDVLQAKSNFVDAQRLLQVSEGQVQTTMGQLATTLGYPAETKLGVTRLPVDLHVGKVQEGVEELMCEAREARPDLMASFAELRQKHQEVRQAVSESLPVVTALGSGQVYNFMGNTGNDGSIYTGGIEVSVPVFRGWYYYNNIRKKREEEGRADASLRETELSVYLDVWTSYTNLNTAVETVAFTNQLLIYTEEAYQAALANYKQGTGSFLDVLNTQDSLANARYQWVQARTSWLTSLAQLAYATGRI